MGEGMLIRPSPNGLRMDLAQAMADTAPKVWRFPGGACFHFVGFGVTAFTGNNLEGDTPATRWKWNETIGPLENRPGRQGDWGEPSFKPTPKGLTARSRLHQH